MENLDYVQAIGIALMVFALLITLMTAFMFNREMDKRIRDEEALRIWKQKQLADRNTYKQQAQRFFASVDKQRGQVNNLLARYGSWRGNQYKPVKVAKVLPMRRTIIPFKRPNGSNE